MNTHLQNILNPGDPFDIDVYLSYRPHGSFFFNEDILSKTPDWSERGLTYDYSILNDRHMNLTIPVKDRLLRNNTLYLHMQVTILNPFYSENG